MLKRIFVFNLYLLSRYTPAGGGGVLCHFNDFGCSHIFVAMSTVPLAVPKTDGGLLLCGDVIAGDPTHLTHNNIIECK